MKQLPYPIVRDMVRSGDGLFFRGHEFPATAILKFTDLSHVAMIVRYDEMMPHYNDQCVQTVEVLTDGLRPHFFSERVRDEILAGNDVYWLKVHLTNEQRALCREYAMVEIPKSKSYGFGTLVSMAFGYHPIDGVKNWVCSEWYGSILISCGLVDWQVAPKPGDIPKWLGPRAGDLVKIIGPKLNELEVE
uniref:Uncharacterized protein n=1 Tax=viral metagenome TaxID=1070528 RepID=A0A6M3L5S7_9ZZZZ